VFLLNERVVFALFLQLEAYCLKFVHQSIYIVDCEELKPTSEFAVTVFISFICRFPQYTAMSDQVVRCKLSWHILKGCTCYYMTFSYVWHNLLNNL
jgi:hypothetical protein